MGAHDLLVWVLFLLDFKTTENPKMAPIQYSRTFVAVLNRKNVNTVGQASPQPEG
jgi:hypothetical protein